MNNTIYLADTCALEEERCRKQILNTILNEPNNRLTVLPSVNGELKRHSKNKEDEEEKARGAAALEFLKKNYEQIIHHPLQDGYKGGAVADREIMYFCATHRGQNIHLLTHDENLATAVAEHCPTTHVQLFKAKGGFQEQATLLGKQYTELCTGHHVYITAAAVNTAVAAGVQHLFPAAAMKYNTASFRTLTPQALEYLLTVSAWEKQTAAHAEVSEKDELTARLLTHPADAKKGVLLLLGEGDEQAPYLALHAKQYKALANSGFSVFLIGEDGLLTQLAAVPTPKKKPAPKAQPTPKPAQKPKKPTQTEQKNAPTPPAKAKNTQQQAQAAPPAAPASVQTQTKQQTPSKPTKAATTPAPQQATQESEVQKLYQYLDNAKIPNAGKVMTKSPALVNHAVRYLLEKFDSESSVKTFDSLLNSVTQRKLEIPPACFNYCVSHVLPKSVKLPHWQPLYTVFLKMINLCAPLSACGNAVQRLESLKEKQKEKNPPLAAYLDKLSQAAHKKGAPKV